MIHSHILILNGSVNNSILDPEINKFHYCMCYCQTCHFLGISDSKLCFMYLFCESGKGCEVKIICDLTFFFLFLHETKITNLAQYMFG